MKKTTGELMDRLLEKADLEQYWAENREEMAGGPLSELLNDLLQRHHLQKSQVVAATQLERSYVYHLFSGAKNNPSRDVLLSLSLAMSLPLNEVQTLLRVARHSMLYPRVRRDSIIIRAVAEGLTVIRCNELLEQYGEAPLQS